MGLCLGYPEKCSNLIIDFLIPPVFFSLTSACSHIAAVLFKLEAYFRMNLHKVDGWIFTRSKFCQWKRSFQQAALAPLGKLILADQSRPTHVQKILMVATAKDNLRKNFAPKWLTHD